MKRFFAIVVYFVRTYPLSLLVVAGVLYLSLATLPQDAVPAVPNLDKVVHVGMYLLLSGMLWAEFLRVSYRKDTPLWHAWVGALVCPILFSGVVELLQAYCTTYRGGDWLDFAANSLGALLASGVAQWVRKKMQARDNRNG